MSTTPARPAYLARSILVSHSRLESQNRYGHSALQTRLCSLTDSSFMYSFSPFLSLSLKDHNETPLDSRHARSILVLLQTNQHLTHSLLRASIPTAQLTLSTQIDQFANTFPARTSGRGVLSLGQEFFCFLCGLGLLTVDLAVVGFVERVDVLLGCGYRFLLFARGGFVAAGEVCVALFAPG